MLTIRLQRIGKKNNATYRLVLAEKGRDTQGRNLEILGTYNPRIKVNGFLPKTDRVKYWLEKGAQASNTIHNLLLKAGLITDQKKKKSVYISTKRAAKIAEKTAAKAGQEKSAKPAESAPVEAPATPVEVAPAEAPAVPVEATPAV